MVQTARIGPHVLRGELGRGASARVFSAVHEASGAPVAVKVMTSPGGLGEAWRAAFRAEARAVAALDHPNVVQLHDQGELEPAEAGALGLPERAPYLVMERLDGGSLEPLTPEQGSERLFAVLEDLLSALSHVHARELVHRDLKPANVLLDGRTGQAKLTDFGVVQRLDPDETLTEEGEHAGTPHYMAPEQALGLSRDVGPWTDLYALGCLTWTLCVGEPPFHGANTWAVLGRQLHAEPPPFTPRFELPGGFELWLRGLLRKDPRSRHATAADALWALRALRDQPRPPEPGQAPPMPESWRAGLAPPRPRRWEAGYGLALHGLRVAPFVGRLAERDRCWAALRRVREEGAPRALLLRGPSGCGKSRLAAWLSRRAHETGAALTVTAHHSPDEGPLDGVRGALAQHLRTRGLSAERCAAHLEDRLRQEGIRDPAERRAMLALLTPDPRSVPPPPEQRWALLHRCLAQLARGRAALLVLEDAHWSEEPWRMARWFLERAPRLPLLIVIVAQDEALAARTVEGRRADELDRHEAVEGLHLRPLGPAEHQRFVEQLVGLEPALAAQVAGRTRGSPLFAVQLLGDWVQRGLLHPGPRGLRLPPGSAPPLPDSLYAAWKARLAPALAAMSEAERDAMELAAALGASVDEAEWDDACAIAGLEPAPGALERLISLALASEEEGGWRWAHGMVRESLLRDAEEAGRAARLHAACAEMLSRRSSGEAAVRGAMHQLAAGAGPEALPLLLRGEAAARYLGQRPRADELLEEIRRLTEAHTSREDPLRTQLMMAEAARLVSQGEVEEAAALYARAQARLAEAGDHDRLSRLMMRRVWLQAQRGRTEASGPLLDEAEALLREVGTAKEWAHLCHTRSNWRRERGEFAEAERCAEEGLAHVQALEGDDAERWRAHLSVTLANARLRQGALQGLAQMLEETVASWRRLHEPLNACNALNSLGEVHHLSGRPLEAEQAWRQASELAASWGLPPAARATPELNLAILRLERGQPRAAEAGFRGVLSMPGAARFRLLRAYAWLGLAGCAAALGDWAAWGPRMDEAEALLEDLEAADPDLLRLLEVSLAATERDARPAEAQRARAQAEAQAARLGC